MNAQFNTLFSNPLVQVFPVAPFTYHVAISDEKVAGRLAHFLVKVEGDSEIQIGLPKKVQQIFSEIAHSIADITENGTTISYNNHLSEQDSPKKFTIVRSMERSTSGTGSLANSEQNAAKPPMIPVTLQLFTTKFSPNSIDQNRNMSGYETESFQVYRGARKIASAVRPSTFLSLGGIENNRSEIESFTEFLKENATRSINAKSLLTNNEWYNSKTFLTRFKAEIPLLREIITREIDRPDDSFVFYNGANSIVKFLRMVISAAYKQLEKDSIKSNFVMGQIKRNNQSPQEFLKNTLDPNPHLYNFNSQFNQKNESLFDHEPAVAKELLAGSLLLHDGLYGETSWLFFKKNSSINVGQSQAKQFLSLFFDNFF